MNTQASSILPDRESFKLFGLQTSHETFVLVDLATNRLCHGRSPSDQLGRVIAWIPDGRPNVCLLLAPANGSRQLLLKADGDRAEAISLTVTMLDDGTLALSHPLSGKFLCAVETTGQVGDVAVDRTQLGPWERFTLAPDVDVTADLLALVDRYARISAATVPEVLELLRGPASPSTTKPPKELAPFLRLFGPAELDSLGRGLRRDRRACDAFAALYEDDPWATIALPSLLEPTQPGTFERSIGPSLDGLADAGFSGGFASVGQACNAFARRDQAPTRTLCIVATARNEGLYLLEWIAYHRALGVETFFLYTNDNDDGSDELLHALVQAGIVNWIRNQTSPGVSPQYKAYGHAFQILPEILDYRWAAVIDLDEFIVVDPNLYGSIPAFIAARETATTDSISLCWLMFGPNGHTVRTDELATRRFTTRGAQPNAHVKSICRPQQFIHAQCHYPIWRDGSDVVLRSASGDVHPKSRIADMSAFSTAPNDQHAWIAHLFTKSAEEYILRRSFSRGDVALSLAPSSDLFTTVMARSFVHDYETSTAVTDERAIACSETLARDVEELCDLPGVKPSLLGIGRAYRERLRLLDSVVLRDPRFQSPGAPERFFADVLARSRAGTPVILPPIKVGHSAIKTRRFGAPVKALLRPAQTLEGKDMTSQGLIMDLGVSEGNDTAYYLSKGFRVISVEADPNACHALRARFEQEIEAGSLMLLNLAASDAFGDLLKIFVHKDHQAISGIAKRGELNDDYAEHSVMTVDWLTLVAQAGVPRYVKIDIEGNEAPFLRGMLAYQNLPEFISVECYKFDPIELLFEMGFRRFKLVDQNPPGGFQLPARQIEGLPIESARFIHASGPFGLDVFGAGDWLDFEALKQAWSASLAELHRTWFDCHAWKPN